MSDVVTRAIAEKLAEVRDSIVRLSLEAVELQNALASIELAGTQADSFQKPAPIETVAEDIPSGRADSWTVEEIETLKAEYPRLGTKVTDLLPNRTPQAIRRRAWELDLQGPTTTRHRFTAEEDAILRQHYPSGGSNACLEHLPHLTASQIKTRCTRFLDLRCGRGKGLRRDQSAPVPTILPVLKSLPVGRTFEEQLEAVRNGARLVEIPRLRAAEPDRTLGGVVGEIL
jgi:hypothetical protein